LPSSDAWCSWRAGRKTPLLKPATSAADWVLLILLAVQTATGVYMGLFLRWGSQWYLHTAVPYFHSLLVFQPQVGYMADFPPVFKLHAAGAFLIIALLPFTKLVHLLFLPIAFSRTRPFCTGGDPRRPGNDGSGKRDEGLPCGNAGIIHPRSDPMASRVLTVWDPEDKEFWGREGKAIANRNLWISIPALFLAFAVWMVWSVVVVNLPGHRFPVRPRPALLARRAARPGRRDAAHLLLLHGADLRRAEMDHHQHRLPADSGDRHGLRGAEPGDGLFDVPDPRAAVRFRRRKLRLQHVEHQLFLPQARKGTALGLNAGLGNLGVSAMQFLVPLAITAGVFGALGGEPQMSVAKGVARPVWLQNAGFIWVPFIVASTVAAWFGMNDVASARRRSATRRSSSGGKTTGSCAGSISEPSVPSSATPPECRF